MKKIEIRSVQDLIAIRHKLLQHQDYIQIILEPLRQTRLNGEGQVEPVSEQPPHDYDRALKVGVSLGLNNWLVSINELLEKLSDDDWTGLQQDLKIIQESKKVRAKHSFMTQKVDSDILFDLHSISKYLGIVEVIAPPRAEIIEQRFKQPREDSFSLLGMLKRMFLAFITYMKGEKELDTKRSYVNPTAKEMADVISHLQTKQAKKAGHVISRFRQVVAVLKLMPLSLILYIAGFLPDRISQASWLSKVKQEWSLCLGQYSGTHLRIKNKAKLEDPLLADGFVTVANHPSFFEDAGLRAVMDVSCIAKSGVKNWWVFGRIAQAMGAIFTNRDGNNYKPGELTITDQMVARLQQGKNIGVYPQGGCRVSTNDIIVSRSAGVVDYFAGAFDAAIKSNKPLVIGYWDYSHYHHFAWVGKESLARKLADTLFVEKPTAVYEVLKIIDVKEFVAKYQEKYKTELKYIRDPGIRHQLLREILQDKVRKIFMRREPGYNAFTAKDTFRHPLVSSKQQAPGLETTLWARPLSDKHPVTYAKYLAKQQELDQKAKQQVEQQGVVVAESGGISPR